MAKMTPRGPRWTGKVRLVPDMLDLPKRWQRPRRIFVNSMSDLFHEGLSNQEIKQVFDVMLHPDCSHHTFQILTKRPARMKEFIMEYYGHPLNKGMLFNIWLGVSVEDMVTANERIPHLIETPAGRRFISAEPLLGPIELYGFLAPDACRCRRCRHAGSGATFTVSTGGDDYDAQCPNCGAAESFLEDLAGLDWVIVGGESGPGARRMDICWVRKIVEQCKAKGTPVFVKQMGTAWASENRLTQAKGDLPDEWPEDIRVRQFPTRGKN